MELTKELSIESLPSSRKSSVIETVATEENLKPDENHSLLGNEQQQLEERVEDILRGRVQEGVDGAEFQLGQLFFEKVIFSFRHFFFNIL